MSAGRIVLDMPNPALDRNGDPYAGAKLYFYQGGTSILLDAFTDATLSVPLSNPVISDGAGRFSEMWGDTGQPYDVKWTDANDALIYPFTNIFPFLGNAVDGSGNGVTDPAAFRDALGLGTAALEDSGAAGHTIPFLDGDNTWSGDNNFTGDIQQNGHGLGYLRIIPNEQNADYTFAFGDRGFGIWHTSATPHTWTIPTNAMVAPQSFRQGDNIYLRNIGTGAITIKRTAGVVLRIAGVATDADATLASYGSATLIMDDDGDQWAIVGVGLS